MISPNNEIATVGDHIKFRFFTITSPRLKGLHPKLSKFNQRYEEALNKLQLGLVRIFEILILLKNMFDLNK